MAGAAAGLRTRQDQPPAPGPTSPTPHVPAPHLKLLSGGIPASAQVELPPVPAVAERPAGGRQAESPESTIPPPPHFDVDAADRRTSFYAQWEVDRFHWPVVCNRLADRAGEGLSDTAKTLLDAARDGRKVVAIVSDGPGAGGTTVALCLARHLVEAGASVVLVDADFRRTQLASRLGMNVQVGWEDLLAGRPLTPEDVAVASIADRLVLLPLRGASQAPGPGVDAGRAGRVLGELRAHFDVVLVAVGDAAPESPAWCTSGDLKMIDTAVLVRDVRSGDAEPAGEKLDALGDAGIMPLGVVENFAVEE